jgi:hypothetical protein
MDERKVPTNPAPPMSDHELLVSVMELVSLLAADLRAVVKETTGISKAFHDVNGNLAALRADSYIATEQMQTVAMRMGEVERHLLPISRRLGEVELRLAAMSGSLAEKRTSVLG